MSNIAEISSSFLAQQGCPGLNWRILFTKEQIEIGISKLAHQLNAHYRTHNDKPLVLVGILKGVFVFLADLVRELNIPHSIYFLEASSYKGQKRGQLQFSTQIEPAKLRGRRVLVVDELFDHGETMNGTVQALLANQELDLRPEDIRTCTLFIKDSGTNLPVPDFVGMPRLPALWLVGYGLDHDGEKRGWPHLFATPKADNIDRVPEDAIFDSEEAYAFLFTKLSAELFN